MNKQMILLATVAVGAAATAFAPAAEARGGHGGHFGFHFHHQWTPSFERSDDEPVVVHRRVIKKVYVEKKAPAVAASPKTGDGKGRLYDPAAKVWFDGKGQCWSGKEAFGFKNGNWFYGSARWYELNGTWKTNAAEGPATIDCEASPMIAAKLDGKSKAKDDATAKSVGQGNEEKVEPKKKATAAAEKTVKVATEAPAKAADAPKPTECKKYFPSVGEMLTVPCGQ
jgi:hypothetical protein